MRLVLPRVQVATATPTYSERRRNGDDKNLTEELTKAVLLQIMLHDKVSENCKLSVYKPVTSWPIYLCAI